MEHFFFCSIYTMPPRSSCPVERASRRATYAWAKYYEVCAELHDSLYDTYNHNMEVLEYIATLPTHLVQEIEDANEKLKVQITCPICYEVIEKGHTKITYCGHKYCDECFPKLEKCAICRKTFQLVKS